MLDAGTTEALLGQVFTGGTALAGLILVFLGGTVAAFDSYDASAKSSVRGKYQRRAIVALLGFLLSLGAATTAMGARLQDWPYAVAVGLTLLALAFLLTIAAAVMSVWDLS